MMRNLATAAVFGMRGLKQVLLASAILVTFTSTTSRAETSEPLDGGRANVVFPRGAPVTVGRKDPVLTVRDANEAFVAAAWDEPSSAELKSAFRTCPATMKTAQAKITARCWEIDGDPVKQVTTAIANGDLIVVRLIAHAGRIYQAQYTRHGGAGPISDDGDRFLASLQVSR